MSSVRSIIDFMSKNIGEDEYPHLDNEQLVSLYQQGGCTFNQVLIRYNPLLVGKSSRWVPGYDREDVYQELLTKLDHTTSVWKSDQGTKFITYLEKALEQHLNHIIRRQVTCDKRKANLPRETEDGEIEEIASYEVMLEGGYDQETPWEPCGEEELKSLIEILSTVELSDREKICIDMVFEGEKNVDIAEALGVSSTRVTSILQTMKDRFSFLRDPIAN